MQVICLLRQPPTLIFRGVSRRGPFLTRLGEGKERSLKIAIAALLHASRRTNKVASYIVCVHRPEKEGRNRIRSMWYPIGAG